MFWCAVVDIWGCSNCEVALVPSGIHYNLPPDRIDHEADEKIVADSHQYEGSIIGPFWCLRRWYARKNVSWVGQCI